MSQPIRAASGRVRVDDPGTRSVYRPMSADLIKAFNITPCVVLGVMRVPNLPRGMQSRASAPGSMESRVFSRGRAGCCLTPSSYPPQLRARLSSSLAQAPVSQCCRSVWNVSRVDLQLAQAGPHRPRRGGRQTTDLHHELAPRSGGSRSEIPSWQSSGGQRGAPRGGHEPKRGVVPVIGSLTGQGFGVVYACRTLGVSESGQYAWKDRPDPTRPCGAFG
jgi:hypothetical protein